MVHSIQFQLFAPYNAKASLIGNFSDWEEIPMEKDKDGYFRTSVELADGSYQYKFRVQSKSWFFEPDEWVDVTDPYARQVIDDENQNAVIRIKDGEPIVDTYVWQHDNVPLPVDNELVIYELHIADFVDGEKDGKKSRYQRVIDKLDYLVELGINAIEFMPMQEFPGRYSWGYNPRHFFATESSYGSSEDLKRLIDECHGHGIRVIMDGIYNHSESSAPLTQVDHDYWYHHEPQDPDNSWGPEFNYEHYDENLETYPARKFIGDVVRYWIEEYHIDGIRYDAARQLGNYDFMGWIVDEAHRIASMKPFYNVAEHVPDTPEITNVDGPMDGCWHVNFSMTVKDHIFGDTFDLERLKDAIDGRRRGYLSTSNIVNYLVSHDQERLMVELANREMFDQTAFKRARLGYAILATAVGIPLILQGEEFGEYKPLKAESNPLDWTLLDNEDNQNLLSYCKGLIHLRKSTYALYSDNLEFFYEDEEAKVIAYVRWNNEGSRVVVIANLSDNFLENYEVQNFPEAGTWHEWTYDYDVEVEGDRLTLDLGEFEAKVFVT